MAYITPNSTIVLLKDINFDEDYTHTAHYNTATDQYNDLYENRFRIFNNNSYVRTERGYIRLQANAEDLLGVNYMMFRNTNYGTKWFYAFVNDIIYINNNCCEIKFTIDDIQTWMFDMEVDNCFVEREHTVTDNIGENTIPEDFNFGNYMESERVKVLSGEMLGGIITDLPLNYLLDILGTEYHATVTAPDLDNEEVGYDLKTIEEFQSGLFNDSTNLNGFGASNRAQTGLVNGLYIYTGFSLKYDPTLRADDQDYYYQKRQSNPNDKKVADLSTIISGLQTDTGLQISNTIFHDDKVTKDNIIAIFQYPKEFSRKAWLQGGKNSYDKDGVIEIGIGDEHQTYQMPTLSEYKGKVNSNTYMFSDVKNKKLFTSPYIFFDILANTGVHKQYNYEDFKTGIVDDNGICVPLLYIVGSVIGKTDITVIPSTYRGAEYDNIAEKFSFDYQYNPFYSGNAYAEYMQKNANQVTAGFTAAGIGFIGSVLTSLLTVNPLPAIGGALAAGTSVAKQVANLSDLKNVAPSSYFTIDNPIFNCQYGFTGLYILCKTIDGESAKIVDDYFSMFGYAVKRVKIPNIFKYWNTNDETAQYHIRPYWNYVKTNGAIIHAKLDESVSPTVLKGIPANVEKHIAEILDRGITFWNGNGIIGKYERDNSPVIITPPTP